MKLDLTSIWYRKSLHPIAMLLLPFAWMFGACVAIRRWLYRLGVFKTWYFKVPVIVVGNITVGGTGKTPFVIGLVKLLQSQGYRPGIVSRGVGGEQHAHPHWVKPNDSAKSVGDEALLLLQNSHCPIVICVDRVAAVRELLQRSNCNVVISDDGLQHYRLGRALEIVMVDGVRRFGNSRLLPAGPLREPPSRLHMADCVVVNGDENEFDEYTMSLEQDEFVSVMHPQQRIHGSEFSGTTVHAIAGIGHPERFFRMLKNAGINLITHSFPDHHLYQARELDFSDDLNVIMTEKDAVKCGSLVDERYWYLRITAKMNQKLEQTLLMKLKLLEASDQYETDFAMHSCDATRRFQRDDIR